MHLLYIDESGYPNSADQCFVLAGVSVFERHAYFLARDLDKIAARFELAHPNIVELHGSPMFSGNKAWRKYPRADREQAIKDALHVLATSSQGNRIFAAVLKQGSMPASDMMEHCFLQLASRFDYYLGRLQNKYQARGMLLFDKSVHEVAIQNKTTVYRNIGHDWGRLKHFAEVPAFIDSKSSRLIQLADLVAYAIFRKYSRDDDRFFSIIKSRFDSDQGQQHGLYVR